MSERIESNEGGGNCTRVPTGFGDGLSVRAVHFCAFA